MNIFRQLVLFSSYNRSHVKAAALKFTVRFIYFAIMPEFLHTMLEYIYWGVYAFMHDTNLLPIGNFHRIQSINFKILMYYSMP